MVKDSEKEPDTGSGVIELELSHFTAIDIDSLLPVRLTDGHTIAAALNLAAEKLEENSGSFSSVQALRFLAALSSMQLRTEDRKEPFRPLWIIDGKRSAALEDFRAHKELLRLLSERIQHSFLKARLADLAWFYDRRQHACAEAAVKAYVLLIEEIQSDTPEKSGQADCLSPRAHEFLSRAIQITELTRLSAGAGVCLRNLTTTLRHAALRANSSFSILFLCRLDLVHSLCEPKQIGEAICLHLKSADLSANVHLAVELELLAAKAFRMSGLEERKFECRVSAADRLRAEAFKRTDSVVVSAHYLGLAIAYLAGVPNQRDKRKEWRHQLVDMQTEIPEEMHQFSEAIDISEIVREVRDRFDAGSLIENIFKLVKLSRSEKPEDLKQRAIAQISKFPLQSLMSVAHVDRQGKTIHRSSRMQQDNADDAVANNIAQMRGIHRSMTANLIDVARAKISARHFISGELLSELLFHSPFVEPGQLISFSSGAASFLCGDYRLAVYSMTPLLESCLRYLLKGRGHDVSIFDDASQTQQDRTLSSLYESMRPEIENVIGVSLAAEIESVFLNWPGANLRNSLCHGLLLDDEACSQDAIYACWLMLHIALLPLVRKEAELANILSPEYVIA